jgi:hypothetical protein
MNTPKTPEKKTSYGIPVSSPYYSSEEENEDLNNNAVEEVNTTALVNLVRKRGVGNTHGPLGFHPQLNLQTTKLKLPSHLKGGKKTRKHKRKAKIHKAKKTRKHKH